jgi:hypothetical protein
MDSSGIVEGCGGDAVEHGTGVDESLPQVHHGVRTPASGIATHSVPAPMSHYEQPTYVVVGTRDAYEVRRYDSYLVAETTVAGSFDATGNPAFRRLAGFIFGRNADGVKMNMTVPVTRTPIGTGAYRYRFVMEQAYSEDSVPRPVDDSIAVVRVPAGHYAALRYRGSRNEATYLRAEAALLAALERDGIAAIGTPASAVYNGPFTPSLLRRNEVLVPVSWEQPQGA